eukprot:gene5131-7147_t
MLALVCVFLSFIIAVNAGCDNSCSGHGTCGFRGVCKCYDNWGLGMSHDSGDCSERICPYEFAWVDTPDKIGSHHKYAECSNKGICNRETGDCECFPGYEGKGCQRTACPNDCSGHGRCTYIEDLLYKSEPDDYYASGDFTYVGKDDYYYWDKSKTRGCVCDPEYTDVDCSKRMCQFATDVMDQRDNTLVSAKYQTQQFELQANRSDIDQNAMYPTKTFALVFKSKLNETYTTQPIDFFKGSADFHSFVLNIQNALLKLPNRVIDKVEVHGKMFSDHACGINVTFTGDNVQGPQHLITVKSILCGDGCSPKLTGLELVPFQKNITEVQYSDYNSYECGRRGKCDYTTGLCTCFAGYTGLACNVITSLV